MNNNRGNNRRRGRGNNNNNRPQNGNSQVNRIDSRARGNAPQLLEKYRKLAQDAHLNGDRVQAEYYLQFADHYFRVLADARLRQEEQRARQTGGTPGVYPAGVSGDRWQDQDADEDLGDFGGDPDFPSFDRVPQPRREDAPRREEREPREYQRDNQRDNQRDGQREFPRENQRDNGYRDRRDTRDQRRPAEPEGEGVRAAEGEPVAPAADNPFIRPFNGEGRGPRGPRGRNDRFAARQDGPREERAAEPQSPPRLDPASLPPAIGVRSEPEDDAPRPARTGRLKIARPAPIEAEAPAAPAPVAEEAAPAPRKRGRPRKNPLPETVDGAEG